MNQTLVLNWIWQPEDISPWRWILPTGVALYLITPGKAAD